MGLASFAAYTASTTTPVEACASGRAGKILFMGLASFAAYTASTTTPVEPVQAAELARFILWVLPVLLLSQFQQPRQLNLCKRQSWQDS